MSPLKASKRFVAAKGPAQLPAYDPHKHGLSQGLLSGFLKCREFARLSIEGWKPLRTGGALQFGIMAHGVLDKVYIQVRDNRRRVAPEKPEVLRLIQKEIDSWEASPAGQRMGPEDVQQLELNAALLEAVLPGYFKFWEKEDFQKVKWVSLEEWFEFELFGVKLHGRIDGLFRAADGTLQVFETKTKGRIEEENIFDLLAFDFQTDFYTVAAQQIHGERPTGARYNIIRRPGEKLKKQEKLSAFKARVEKAVEKEPEYYFQRFRINKPVKDFERFMRELEFKIREFVAWREGKLPTYRNETACMGKFGACSFLKICANGNYKQFYKKPKLLEELGVVKESK